MSWTKRAQSGAAILVALTAVLIIMYVLFLPPADRAQLLGENQPGSTQPGATTNIIFTSTVGRVSLPTIPNQVHNLPALSIRASESGEVLAQRDTITARNNVFEKQPVVVTFAVDPSLTKNAVLSMNLDAKSAGNLIITLNGQEIFNQEVNSRSIPPIALSNLQTQNTLTFATSTVGFAFWTTNTYKLSNIKVTADVTDLSGASAKQHFTITDEEYKNMDSAQLSFVPICNQEGKVILSINSVEMFSGVPDCGSLNTLEIAPSRLQPGENTFSVDTRNADMVIDRASISTKSKQEQNKLFSFTVDPTKVQGKKATIRVLFADSVDKRGIILVNGNTIAMQAQSEFSAPITQFIRSGANTVQFQALDKDFEIVKFDVVLN